MTNKEYIDKYLEYINYNKNYATNTYRHYENIIVDFCNYIEPKNIDNINLEIFENFFISEKIKISKVSKNNYISCIKNFLEYLNEKHKCQISFIDEIEYLKNSYDIKYPFTIRQIRKIFECLENNEISIIIVFLYYSGIRVSECTNIKITDVDLQLEQVLINGKGNKQRYVPIVKAIYEEINKRVKKNKKYLFEIDGKQINRQKINLLMQEFEIKNELKFHMYPHKLRRSIATHLIERNMDVRELQKFLGHDSILSTEKYVSLSKDKLKNKMIDAFK